MPTNDERLYLQAIQETERDVLEKETSAYYSFVSSPSGLTKYTIFFLWALIAMSIVDVMMDVMQLNLLENTRTFTTQYIKLNDSRVLIVKIVHGCIILIASIMVLMWQYKANENCHGFGAQGMRFTPGWTVGWHFVPFMSFFRPYQVMQEIWKVSTDPIEWSNQAGSVLINWWWATCLISIFIGKAFSKIVTAGISQGISILQLEQATTSSIVTNCAILVNCIMTIWVISVISEKQKKLTLNQPGANGHNVTKVFLGDDVSNSVTGANPSTKFPPVQNVTEMPDRGQLKEWPQKSEEDLFALAHAEFQGEGRRPGLWAKCIGETLNDEKKAEALYINYRTKQLMDDQIEQIKSCKVRHSDIILPVNCPNCDMGLQYTYRQWSDIKKNERWIQTCPRCCFCFDVRNVIPNG